MIPVDMECLGVRVLHDLEEAVSQVDVVMMLRIQLERQNEGLFPSFREYSNLYCLTADKLKHSRKNILIMHPGPVNRGVEIALDVMEGSHSVILDQVYNGVALRMALMYLLLGGGSETDH